VARQHDDWIEAYLEYTRHSESPESFHYWTAISVLAGAARRRVFFDMGYFKWYPNFFIMFVAPPGIVSKSTTANIGMSLLRRVPGIKFGPDTVTWQALVTALADAREDYQLPDGAFEPMCSVTLVSSELGNLLQPGDQSIINLLTHLWDCPDDPFEKTTKKDGTETIVNPWLNFLGCTTPSWIAENFSGFFITGGFASRALFVYAEHKRQLVPYPSDRMDRGRLPSRDRLIADLEHIATLQGPMLLTPEAHEWGRDWYVRHNASDNPLRSDARFGGYFARKQTHLHKTAMVLSLARRSTLSITVTDMEEADAAITKLEENMLAVFGEMNKEAIVAQQIAVLSHIRAAGPLSKSQCYHRFMTQMGYQTFTECLNGLLASGLIELRAVGANVILAYNDSIERKLVDAPVHT